MRQASFKTRHLKRKTCFCHSSVLATEIFLIRLVPDVVDTSSAMHICLCTLPLMQGIFFTRESAGGGNFPTSPLVTADSQPVFCPSQLYGRSH